MVKTITTYPTPPSVEYSTDVRTFTDETASIIEDLKDTIDANSLEALTAFQIGSMYNIVVLKHSDGTFLELINPRVFNTKGSITTRETTAYFPGLSANVTRHENISIVYEDRDLQQHSLKAQGHLSILLQRKIDYTFGSSFLNKLSPEEKEIFEKKLEFGSDVAISEVCPTTFNRDKITKVINLILIVMLVVFGSSFFMNNIDMFQYQLYLFYSATILSIIYFFYAQYESYGNTSCSGCQIGNILGTVAIIGIKLTVIMGVSYFVMN